MEAQPSGNAAAVTAAFAGLPPRDVIADTAAAAVASAVSSVAPFPWPLYLIGTRDSFTYHLLPRVTAVHSSDGRVFHRTEYFFREDELPPDYWNYAGDEVGFTSWHGGWSVGS